MQRLGIEVSLGNPANHLDITQTTRAFLDIGLQVVCGVMVLLVTLDLLFELGIKKFCCRPDLVSCGCIQHRLHHFFTAAEQTAFHQAGGRSYFLFCLGHTGFNRADAVTKVEPGIPKQRDKRFDGETKFICWW